VDVTIVVATYGDPAWQTLAHRRAIPSAQQFGVPVIYHHGESLHEARNHVLNQVETEFVIHLDADDELEPGYLAAMASGTCDLRAPAVRYIMPGGRPQRPMMPKVSGHTHQCTAECLPFGNWLVVGACARTQLLRDVGGWRDFTWSEDWDLWARCHLAGATVEAIGWAIYRAHMRPNSRNRSVVGTGRLEVHRAIARANGLPVP
jgi:hypothetical protein